MRLRRLELFVHAEVRRVKDELLRAALARLEETARPRVHEAEELALREGAARRGRAGARGKEEVSERPNKSRETTRGGRPSRSNDQYIIQLCDRAGRGRRPGGRPRWSASDARGGSLASSGARDATESRREASGEPSRDARSTRRVGLFRNAGDREAAREGGRARRDGGTRTCRRNTSLASSRTASRLNLSLIHI